MFWRSIIFLPRRNSETLYLLKIIIFKHNKIVFVI
jgi:hypothetical protein